MRAFRSSAHLIAAVVERTLKQIADHLTLRVTEEFKLPVDADLVAEAKIFCEELLK